jgi:hypothetical protein
MKKLNYILFFFCLIFVSCSNDDTTQSEDSQKLDAMYNEIITLSLVNSQPCTNPDEWSFTAVNSSACGQNAGFIAYSKKINKEQFIKKVEKYLEAQIAFNKNGISHLLARLEMYQPEWVAKMEKRY